MGNNEQITETVETAAITLEELAKKVASLEGKLAKTAKVAKRGAIGVGVAAVTTVAALIWRKKAKRAQKKAERAAKKAEDASEE